MPRGKSWPDLSRDFYEARDWGAPDSQALWFWLPTLYVDLCRGNVPGVRHAVHAIWPESGQIRRHEVEVRRETPRRIIQTLVSRTLHYSPARSVSMLYTWEWRVRHRFWSDRQKRKEDELFTRTLQACRSAVLFREAPREPLTIPGSSGGRVAPAEGVQSTARALIQIYENTTGYHTNLRLCLKEALDANFGFARSPAA